MQTDLISRRDMLRLLAATSVAGALPAALVRAAEANQHVAPAELPMGTEQIAILVYPEFTALDALGPHYFLSGMMGATVRFVAKTSDPVVAEGASLGGFQVRPHCTFTDCPAKLDLLLVPGGLVGTLAAIEDDATRHFLAERAADTKLMGSVCTGSLLLGAAGLLKGHRATSHWQTLEVLKDVGAIPVAERVVFDGSDRVTAAGVSAGLDLGLELVRRYRGDFYAEGMQLLGEYEPRPAFPGGGDPRTADKRVVTMLNMMHAPIVEKFRDAIQKVK